MPNRFKEDEDHPIIIKESPPAEEFDENKMKINKALKRSEQNTLELKTSHMTRRNTYVFKLPGADAANATKKSMMQSNDMEKQDTDRSGISNSIKKYNYTKNSLNCIPLSNKFRQLFIRFVEWKHQGNIILAFVAVNSIFLGLVDYRFKGKYNDPDAPWGNYILGITEPMYAVLFTGEAVVKIIAQGFILSKKTYLRDSWNALDFAVVITALLSFSPDISSVSILRAFRLFKPLRNLQVFPSMRLLIRTLVASADRLRFLMIFYFFVIMIFSIIGVNLMQGVTTFRCRQTQYPVMGDWLVVENDHRSCGWAHLCETTCGSLYDTDLVVNGTLMSFNIGNVTDLTRDSVSKELLFGYANFNNMYQGFLTLFQISTLQDWYKIMYLMQDSYNSYISGMFFVIYVLISNYFMHILTVGIIMQRFIELNDHKERQHIYQKILGMEQDGESRINIEELKNRFREEEKKNKELKNIKKSSRTFRESISHVMSKIHIKQEERPVPDTKYYKNPITKFCWKIQQNLVIETCLTLAAIVNAFMLAFVKYPEDVGSASVAINYSIDYVTLLVAIVFAADMLSKLIGMGLRDFITNYENCLYSLTSIGSLLHMGFNGGKASPITACTVFKIFKIIRRSNYSQAFNQLIDSILYTLSVMLSYCAIMVLFVYIFSLLGMQFFAGQLLFDERGYYDPINGSVPRQNFDTMIWSVTTVLQTLIGDDWSLVMFNCMIATGWYACLYFICLIMIGYIILMNLFLAILIGNFEEASLIMRDTKFLITIQKATDGKSLTENALIMSYGQNPFETDYDDRNQFPGSSPTRNKQISQVGTGGAPRPLIVVDAFLKSMNNGSSRSVKLKNSIINNDSSDRSVNELPLFNNEAPGDALSGRKQSITKRSEKTISPTVFTGVNTLKGSIEENLKYPLSPPQKKQGNQVIPMSQQLSLNVRNRMDALREKENQHSVFSSDIDPNHPNGSISSNSNETEQKSKYDNQQTRVARQQTVMMKMLRGNNDAMVVTYPKKRDKIVKMRRQNPIQHYMQNSSLCLFNKKSKFRQAILKTVINPEHMFHDNQFKQVTLDDLEYQQKKEMISQGYKKSSYILHRTSTFFSIQWEAKEANNLGSVTALKNQKTLKAKKNVAYYIALNMTFNYFVSFIIFANLILLLMSSPLNEPTSERTKLVMKLDIMCTFIFIIEALLKIIALGFINTSIKGHKPYLLQLWNLVDFLILTLSLIDIFYVYPRFDGLPNSFKCIRTVHLLKLFKKNDLIDIIVNTMYRSLKPIMITLVMTLTFLFIYALIGVSLLRGQYYFCDKPDISINITHAVNKYDCLNLGANWVNPERNFDNVLVAMMTLFEMMSSEDWLQPTYGGIDAVGIDLVPIKNANQIMLLFFLPFMIVGHIFIWRMFSGVMIENFNRARDKFYDYALMTSEQRNWVEMQRSLIEKRLKVRIDDHMWIVRQVAKDIIQSQKFDYFILGCIMANTVLQAVSYYGNPKEMDQAQNIASYIFAAVFNIECFLKMLALGKYYFWESHNIFDFALIIGTDMGILLTMAFPNFSIGPLATLLRAFRIGRVLRLLKEKKSLKMLIDTIFYIFPILINIVLFMMIIILVYSIIGIHLFAKVMYQVEVNDNANFQSLGGALLLLFRCVTGEKWNLLMREFSFEGDFKGKQCLLNQSYENYTLNGPMECGSIYSYPFFLSFVILMQMMVVNLFIAIVLEGFAQFSIQNNSIVSSQDYDMLIELWSFYDPTATGWIKPKHLAFLIYELAAPLGKQEDYKEILKKTLDHNTMIKQYSDKKAINMKTKFIYNDQKGLILPHNTVLKLLIELSLPVYSFEANSVCHFKDVCLTITKKAMQRHIDSKKDLTENRRNIEQQFDRIPEEQQKRLDEGWRKKYKNLQKAILIEDYDTGKLWAGLYILKMMRSVNNGFGRTQFKKKLAQDRLFKKLQRKNNLQKKENIGEKAALRKNSHQKQKEITEKSMRPVPIEGNIEIVDQDDEMNTDRNGDRLLIPGNKSQQQFWDTDTLRAGGPQRRGRSPNMLRDHQKSTWWQMGADQNNSNWMQQQPNFLIGVNSGSSNRYGNNRVNPQISDDGSQKYSKMGTQRGKSVSAKNIYLSQGTSVRNNKK